MCKKSRNLHGKKATKNNQKTPKKTPKKTSKKQVKQVFSSYSGKDEYNHEQDAYAFFLANEDVLY